MNAFQFEDAKYLMQFLFQPTKRELKNTIKLLDAASASSPTRRKHFAGVFEKKWFAIAENQYSECPDRSILRHYKYPYPHAEYELLRRLNKGDHDTIYVLRKSKSGIMLNSEPCDQCKKFLLDFGVKWVIFSTENGWRKERL